MIESFTKFRIFINYFLIAAIVVSSLLVVRTLISHTLTKKSTPPAPIHTANSGVTKKKLNDYAPILEKNPFGPPLQLQPIVAAGVPETAPGSLSDLVLLGTVVGPEKLSYAILEDRSKSPSEQDVFAYGEMVFHFGKLAAVRSSSVEIEQNAVTYTLEIDYEQSAMPSRPRTSGQTKSPEPSFVKKLSDRKYEVNRKSVLQSLEQPEHILTDARLLPNIKDGKQEGFVILEVQPGGLYDNLGLKNNDVLLRVNGLAISNPEVAIQAMTALKGMNAIKLDIMRNSEKMSLNYRLR
ncbi:MAG: hypothetical protein JSV11_10445 [Nitrospiraceae bacterium]|nr:MAG: hypothetical protein JSV11_10445 [Nitrospiraceae bacterium]